MDDLIIRQAVEITKAALESTPNNQALENPDQVAKLLETVGRKIQSLYNEVLR